MVSAAVYQKAGGNAAARPAEMGNQARSSHAYRGSADSPRWPVHSLCCRRPGICEAREERANHGASIIPDGRESELARGLTDFAEKTGWKIRLITRNGPGSFPSGDEVRSVWNLDAKTIVVIDDVSSPNVLNFNTGDRVREKLPRQFFTELQSRFGNQFYIAEEGNAKALTETVGALRECLERDNGCRFVPGLVDDLYFLTLACSVAAGAVFGFSARVPLSGRVNNQLTWILTFAPLWAFLLVSFGILPVTSRTAELEPLLKNGAGFLAAAMAVYLTPILGTPELPFSGTAPKADADDDET